MSRQNLLKQKQMSNDVEFDKLQIVPKLPSCTGIASADDIPAGLIGATILDIGTLEDQRKIPGGGLIIDFRPASSVEPQRVVLGNSELGMWIEYQAELSRNRLTAD
jgi:hypothetical protein